MKVIALMIGLVLVGVLAVANVAAAESSPSLSANWSALTREPKSSKGFATHTIEEKTTKNGKKVTDGYSYDGTRTEEIYVLTVVVGDITYTAEHAKAVIFGYNPTDMVVNDPVNIRVEKNKLIFVRPNGKEYKTTIVRMERNPGPTSTH